MKGLWDFLPSTTALVVTASAAVLAAGLAYQYRISQVYSIQEKDAKRILYAKDTTTENVSFEEGLVQRGTKKEVPRIGVKRNRTIFAVRLARACLADLGRHSRSPEQTEIYSRWMRRHCKDLGVRDTHVMAILPLAVEVLYVPTTFETEARTFSYANAVRTRIEDHNDPGVSPHPWIPFLTVPRTRETAQV